MEEKDVKKTQLLGSEEKPDLVTRLKENKKLITSCTAAFVVVLVVVFAFIFINKSNAAKADELIAKADLEQNDSTRFELYKEAAKCGHKSGNRAKIMVAEHLYNDSAYAEALTYLEDVSVDDKVVAAGVYSLTGDCYVNLGKYDEALKAYNKAIKKADKNVLIVPVVLFKQANIYREQKNFEAEYTALQTIVDEYPDFCRNSQLDVVKYAERAKTAAGK